MDMKMATRTQVAIIGGGPAGLLLSHMLHRAGIDSSVLERQSRTHVLGRIRAGVLEAGTVELLREVGLGARMDREGHPHNGSAITWEGRPRFFIDTKKFTGKAMMAYGQTAITEDLYAVCDAAGGQIIDEAGNGRLHGLTAGQPYLTYKKEGSVRRIDCDYVAGCDGFHGVSRPSIPSSVLRTYEKSRRDSCNVVTFQMEVMRLHPAAISSRPFAPLQPSLWSRSEVPRHRRSPLL